MAWNPSPEVAAARDFGRRFGREYVVIVHLGPETIGYASWGETKEKCAVAKQIADVAYNAVNSALENGEVILP